jgi:D-beta-D-heptose 7-phosphate kinase/D-beta-D-heptose 1-phosphate adenosyltransferase
MVAVPTLAHSVYDVSGGGETVTAAVGGALGSGAIITVAAALANLAAAVGVSKAGVVTVSTVEFEAQARAHPEW